MLIRNNVWNRTRDFVFLVGVLAAVNWFLAKADPGWIKLNPTPWILPAVLLGARYGFTVGLFSGIGAAGLVALGQWRLNQEVEFIDVLEKHAYTLMSIVASGAAVGELRVLIRRHTVVTEQANKSLTEETARLLSQLEVVRETRHQLQQRLALFNAPLGALDDELIKLFEMEQARFPAELLRCLHEVTGITSAGLYHPNGRAFEQSAVLHPTPPLAEKLSACPLASLAISTDKLASVPDARKLTVEQPFLAALPWQDEKGRKAVLLIQDMPLEHFTMQNLARVELILKWVSVLHSFKRGFAANAAGDHTVAPDAFRKLLNDAVTAAREHGLPSAVLRFDAGNAKNAGAALRKLSATAVAVRFEGTQKLAVLLPFSGEADADEVSQRLVSAAPGLATERYLITESVTGDELWKHVSQS